MYIDRKKRGDYMSQSMVNFRMDSELKKNLEKTCKEMGLTLTSAFTIFATKVTKEQRIPFSLEVDPFYSKENMERLSRSIEEVKLGKKELKKHDLIEDN
jgi:DNA-damage-inducible protein J